MYFLNVVIIILVLVLVATPKHPPSTNSGGSSGSSTSGSSSSSSSAGGSSGSSSSSSSADGSSGGGSSGGGASGGGASGGTTANGAQSADLVSSNKSKNLAFMLSFAAVAGVVIAAFAVPRRTIATKPDHPLRGSLSQRIKLFSNLAQHADISMTRPPRRDEEGRYINADAIV
ncbi:MAG: hypothetical protein ACI8RD_002445 [Bacillariaceae sp.]